MNKRLYSKGTRQMLPGCTIPTKKRPAPKRGVTVGEGFWAFKFYLRHLQPTDRTL
jgi:hypothetical protein